MCSAFVGLKEPAFLESERIVDVVHTFSDLHIRNLEQYNSHRGAVACRPYINKVPINFFGAEEPFFFIL